MVNLHIHILSFSVSDWLIKVRLNEQKKKKIQQIQSSRSCSDLWPSFPNLHICPPCTFWPQVRQYTRELLPFWGSEPKHNWAVTSFVWFCSQIWQGLSQRRDLTAALLLATPAAEIWKKIPVHWGNLMAGNWDFSHVSLHCLMLYYTESGDNPLACSKSLSLCCSW